MKLDVHEISKIFIIFSQFEGGNFEIYTAFSFYVSTIFLNVFHHSESTVIHEIIIL